MTDDLGGFEAAVCLHEQLLRRPDPEAAAAQLCPGRLDPPTRWTADLHPIRAYQAIDPIRLSLAGYDDFHAIPDASLDAAIEGVVDAEGPVHFDTLADRLLAAADVGRLGSRIRERIEARLQALSATPDLSQRGGFVARPAQFLKPPYRDWREAPEKTRRPSGTMAMPERMIWAVGSLVISRPSRKMRPELALGLPQTVISSVVFPAPLAPIRETISPLLTSTDTPCRASILP